MLMDYSDDVQYGREGAEELLVAGAGVAVRAIGKCMWFLFTSIYQTKLLDMCGGKTTGYFQQEHIPLIITTIKYKVSK
jgi:hypothetical protein